MKVRFAGLLFIVSVILLISSCVTPEPDVSWVDYSYTGGSMKKIVVIGLFRNAGTRKEFETIVAQKINSGSDTEAIPSLKFMPPDVEYEHSNMEKIFNDMGIDGILIIRTRSIENQPRYIPGKSYVVARAYPMYYYDYPYYYKYYRYTYETIREPGYYKNTFIVCTESTLFKNSDDKMIWMMQNNTSSSYRTVDGITNPKKEADKTSTMILHNLRSNNFVLE